MQQSALPLIATVLLERTNGRKVPVADGIGTAWLGRDFAPSRFYSLGGATTAFPRSRHAQTRDHGQRRQGCAPPAGLDLDAGASRGRTVTQANF